MYRSIFFILQIATKVTEMLLAKKYISEEFVKIKNGLGFRSLVD
jgi:hypothetical protein